MAVEHQHFGAVAKPHHIAEIIGLARIQLDPRAVATFIQAYAFGLVLADLDERRVPEAALAEVIDRATAGLMTEG